METKQKEGEGEKITSVPPVKESTKTETVISKVEQKFSPETKAKVAEVFKKPSGWQRKFLGIPVWGWIVLGVILVWAGIIVGIVSHS